MTASVAPPSPANTSTVRSPFSKAPTKNASSPTNSPALRHQQHARRHAPFADHALPLGHDEHAHLLGERPEVLVLHHPSQLGLLPAVGRLHHEVELSRGHRVVAEALPGHVAQAHRAQLAHAGAGKHPQHLESERGVLSAQCRQPREGQHGHRRGGLRLASHRVCATGPPLEHGHLAQHVPLAQLPHEAPPHVDVRRARHHHTGEGRLLTLPQQALPCARGVQHHPSGEEVHLGGREALPVARAGLAHVQQPGDRRQQHLFAGRARHVGKVEDSGLLLRQAQGADGGPFRVGGERSRGRGAGCRRRAARGWRKTAPTAPPPRRRRTRSSCAPRAWCPSRPRRAPPLPGRTRGRGWRRSPPRPPPGRRSPPPPAPAPGWPPPGSCAAPPPPPAASSDPRTAPGRRSPPPWRRLRGSRSPGVAPTPPPPPARRCPSPRPGSRSPSRHLALGCRRRCRRRSPAAAPRAPPAAAPHGAPAAGG
eukprot:1188356-Prorocentrum_minimum.AAC.2